MGIINKPEKVKLFTGIIYNKYCKIEDIKSELVKTLNEVDLSSLEMTFDFTDYYNNEMQGPPLYKKIYSFENLIEMEDLAKIKTITNNIEKNFSSEGKRNCNIDPGYLCLSKLILASTKEFYHRIYIGRGIFAELTLYYKDNVMAK